MNLAIFDIDGTLTDTKSIDDACYARTFAVEFGLHDISGDATNYRESTDSGIMREIFQTRLNREPTPDEIARVQKCFMALLQDAHTRNPADFRAVPCAPEAFRRLAREQSWRVAVATGSWRVSAEYKLNLIGIDPAIVPTACAEDHTSRAKIIETAIARARDHYRCPDFRKIVYIGDGHWDHAAAQQLGIHFLGIEAGDHRPLRDTDAKILPGFCEYDEFLAALDGA
jgi:phosphoglycolate phosphatase-like HAD superfamily hydrolase